MTDTEDVSREELLERYEKAKMAARMEQEENKALRSQYVDDKVLQARLRKDLVTDLLRVYEHPDNPFAGFAASRKRYRELGRYPEIVVSDFYGNHSQFLRAAGLADKRNTTTVRNKAARLQTHQEIAEFAQQNVLRWTNRFEKAKGKRGHLEIVVGSDFHSTYCDPLALQVFLETCQMIGPDIVCLNGDVLDFPQFSRHRKLPGHFNLNAYQEVRWAVENIIKPLRELCPETQIDFVIGNHEYRLVNYMADTAPELACFPSLSLDALLGLGEYEVNLVCRANFLAPTAKAKKNDVRENWTIYGDAYVASHGVSCAKFASAAQLERYKMSGTSGHTHRPQVFHDNSLGTGPLSWMSTPMMAHAAVGSDYMPEPSKWNGGFGVASVLPSKRLVSQQLVIVHPGWASFAGRTWEPSEGQQEARRAMLRIGA